MAAASPGGSGAAQGHPARHVLDGAYRQILDRAVQLTAPLQFKRSPSVIGIVRSSADRFLAVLSVPLSAQSRSTLSVRFQLTGNDGSPISSTDFVVGLDNALAALANDPSITDFEARGVGSPDDPASTSLFLSLASLNIDPAASVHDVQKFRQVFPIFLSGFMKTGNGKLRAYLTYYESGDTIAVDLPLAEDDAASVSTASASILGEVAALLRSGIPEHVADHEVEADPYCNRAFDLFAWFLGEAG
ncbi:hypothetical protein F9C11_35560 [Amycolatopsis sp. VS8301801F10]|uniref:hypothetical protein n=1 Tax=Amycolatopsis sp. VS8301801F10 TaxID=2652442 RepID=UPI0038FCCC1A